MPTNVTRLKELLFDTEQARLGELTRRLELLAVAEQQQREGLTYRLKVATSTPNARASFCRVFCCGMCSPDSMTAT